MQTVSAALAVALRPRAGGVDGLPSGDRYRPFRLMRGRGDLQVAGRLVVDDWDRIAPEAQGSFERRAGWVAL